MKTMIVAAAIVLGAAAAAAATAASPVEAQRAASVDARAFETWRQVIRHAPRSTRGCFTAAYPQTAWVETPCQDLPRLPHRPAHGRGVGGDTVGSGSTYGDIIALAGAIGEAEGTFLSITTTGEADSVKGANAYSVQLNANTFETSRCQDAPSGTGADGCYGWQQFVYESDGGIYIQYWLVNWGPKGATCPTQSTKCDGKYVYTDGWCPFDFYGETDCAISSPGGSVPALGPANLAQASLSANAAGPYGNLFDGVVLTQPGTAAVGVAGWNEFPDLAANWQEAEFNIFGAGNNSSANFDAGSTVVIQLSTDAATQARPSCDYDSLTGETNNLSIVATSFDATDSLYPSLVFTESNATGTVPVGNCIGTLSLPGSSTDSYAPGTRQLTIPALQIGWALYSDVVVTVGDIVTPPSGTAASAAVDSYDPETGLLAVRAVSVGPQTYYNAAVTIRALESIGAVAGADRYDGSFLYVPQIEAGATEYGDVIATVGRIVSVGGGMPTASSDTYVASSDQLTIPAVAYGTAVYTNVVIKVGQIESVGTSQAAP